MKLKLVALLLPFAMSLLSQGTASAATPGAIFTTAVDGSIVNANVQYASKCDVYLDGGPGPNAPSGAAGLNAGDYYFQVTDPSGKTLLSTDPVSNRRFHVSASGVIDAYTGTGGLSHPTGYDRDHQDLGAITIRLANASCPADFLDSPNGGGVYKAWVTAVGDFVGNPDLVDSPCNGGCSHGFVGSNSKTDNFKVVATTATFCLTMTKQLVDANTGALSPGLNWAMDVTDSVGVTNRYYTGSAASQTPGSVTECGLVAGTYTVQETTAGAIVVGLKINGFTLPPQSLYSFLWSVQSPNPFVIVFQNQVVGIDQ